MDEWSKIGSSRRSPIINICWVLQVVASSGHYQVVLFLAFTSQILFLACLNPLGTLKTYSIALYEEVHDLVKVVLGLLGGQLCSTMLALTGNFRRAGNDEHDIIVVDMNFRLLLHNTEKGPEGRKGGGSTYVDRPR